MYGSVTKVRVNSTNDAHRVISRLFQKFKIENDSEEFSLFLKKKTQGKFSHSFNKTQCGVSILF